ncbi:MAG TPA: glycosyltransferase family 4 protein [Fervidobacterium sp.]|nr:glycosyltransferase family 4 protein [Fervidobacterium sp.]
MKIVQYAPYFIPYTGGQEYYIYNLSKHLVKNANQVNILTANYPECKAKESIKGILVSRYPCFARPLRNPIVPKLLSPDENISDYDIIHTHNEHSFAAMAAARISKKKNIPLIVTCHGQLRFGNPLYDSIERLYNKSIGRSVFEKSDVIVALSSSDRDYISSFGIDEDKIIVIPNAIDPSDLERYRLKSDELESFREWYNLSDKRVVLFVGQIIQRKGISYLLKSIPQILRKSKEETSFVFVGKGDALKDSLCLAQELEIEGNVIFTGAVSARDLVAFYQISDLFVLPSLSEGLPTSILEAMYFGIPVVSTDIPGVRDHFSEFALLVSPRDEDALADAVQTLLTDRDLAKSLSRKGKALVASQYTWDRVTREYEMIYSNLCEVKSGY